MTITKNKNMVYFLVNGKTKPYSLDINTGIFYGMKGRPVKSVCAEFDFEYTQAYRAIKNKTNLDMLIRYILHDKKRLQQERLYQDQNLLLTADKLDSLNFKIIKDEWSIYRIISAIDSYWEFFLKWHKTIYDGSQGYSDFKEWVDTERYNAWKERYHLNNYPLIPENGKRQIFEIICDKGAIAHSNEVMQAVFYWCGNCGGYEYHNLIDELFLFFKRVGNLLNWCKSLDITPQKQNFFKYYPAIKKQYENMLDIKLNQQIEQVYQKWHNKMAFEYEDWFVTMPQNTQELQDEGEQMDNCVATHYTREYANEKSLICFIRKKNAPDKSVITCEIKPRTLAIVQIKRQHNTSLKQEDANLIKAFKAHLNQIRVD